MLYTDGGTCRSNPGPMAYGIVGLKPTSGRTRCVLLEAHGMIDDGQRVGTNNEAEYLAVINGLKMVRKLGFTDVQLCVDSELVCKQLRGEWSTKNAELQRLNTITKSWIKGLRTFTVEHVPRTKNQQADRLANVAINLFKHQQEQADGEQAT